MNKPKSVAIGNPSKMWFPGDVRVEPFMGPVGQAIQRHVKWPSLEYTDIYNRAYEAVLGAILEYDKGLPPGIQEALNRGTYRP